MAQCVKAQPHIGTAYKLVDVKTGDTYPNLIIADRLIPYNEGRVALEAPM